MECRVGATNNLTTYIATATIEPEDGLNEFVWNDSSSAISSTTVYYWACAEANGVEARVDFSDSLPDSGYNYGSGDWIQDHTNDGTRDMEIQIYVH